MTKSTEKPRHPGEVLKTDFLEPAGLSETAAAKEMDLNVPRINELVRGRRSVTADTALRLARYFGTSPLDWLVMQAKYDLYMAETAAGKQIERTVIPRAVSQKAQR